WIAIVGWPALDHIADVDFLAAEPHCLDHLGEQLARFPHEWDSLRVLLGAGSLADKNELRARIAHAKYQVGPAAAQLATLAVSEVLANLLEGAALSQGRGARSPIRGIGQRERHLPGCRRRLARWRSWFVRARYVSRLGRLPGRRSAGGSARSGQDSGAAGTRLPLEVPAEVFQDRIELKRERRRVGHGDMICGRFTVPG